MENKNSIFTKLTWFNCLALLITLFSMSGCGPLKDSRITAIHDDKNFIELKSLEKGYEAFHRGDFNQAAIVFKALQNADNEEISQKALYALACSQLILADTSETENEAIKQLRIWTDSDPIGMNSNNLKILEALLERMITRAYEEKRTKTELDTKCEHQFQMQLKKRDEQINQLNHKIKAMKGEIVVLKNKIKSIEEIDQKIQEKKNPYHHRKIF